MNAIKFLLKEHAKTRARFSKIAASTSRDSTKINMFMKLCNSLVRHETMEETVWYPFLQKRTTLKTVIKHRISEEKSAAKAIERFKKLKTKTTHWEEDWQEKFEKFHGDVDHHAGEEENKLFPKVLDQVEETELQAIGKKMQAYMAKHKA